ncbi:hypothetical protein IFM89_012482 [Coptis chinensis]|uniref:Uncharacterized protein n=1 Tax=Coptis chinensis TaxID=261450 RepID=A0A835I3N1_9MAGN|nr:hypothetical protein IFM89_012482 [Coptis chinensis]
MSRVQIPILLLVILILRHQIQALVMEGVEGRKHQKQIAIDVVGKRGMCKGRGGEDATIRDQNASLKGVLIALSDLETDSGISESDDDVAHPQESAPAAFINSLHDEIKSSEDPGVRVQLLKGTKVLAHGEVQVLVPDEVRGKVRGCEVSVLLDDTAGKPIEVIQGVREGALPVKPLSLLLLALPLMEEEIFKNETGLGKFNNLYNPDEMSSVLLTLKLSWNARYSGYRDGEKTFGLSLLCVHNMLTLYQSRRSRSRSISRSPHHSNSRDRDQNRSPRHGRSPVDGRSSVSEVQSRLGPRGGASHPSDKKCSRSRSRSRSLSRSASSADGSPRSASLLKRKSYSLLADVDPALQLGTGAWFLMEI